MTSAPGNSAMCDPVDESVDPKVLLDWLVKQCICEWCDGTIDYFDTLISNPIALKRQWRCRVIKHPSYVSKHWGNWLICQQCSNSYNFARRDFSRWIFPVIANMPEHMSLEAVAEIQPMNQPTGEIFYADYVPQVRGERVLGVVLDDCGFLDGDPPAPVRAVAERFHEQDLENLLL